MRHLSLIALAGTIALQVTAAFPAAAQRTPNASADRARPITYAKRGAPVRRVSAGVRGFDDLSLDRQPVVLVAPHDHVPWSIRTQPTLYWRYSGPRDDISRVTLRLTHGQRTDSVALTLPLAESPLQRIDLATLGVTLQRDTDYEWSVVVHRADASPGAPSDKAWIRVVGANTLGTEPNDPVELARRAASVGLWYDAFAALTTAYREAPSDDALGAAWSSFISSTVKGLAPALLISSGKNP